MSAFWATPSSSQCKTSFMNGPKASQERAERQQRSKSSSVVTDSGNTVVEANASKGENLREVAWMLGMNSRNLAWNCSIPDRRKWSRAVNTARSTFCLARIRGCHCLILGYNQYVTAFKSAWFFWLKADWTPEHIGDKWYDFFLTREDWSLAS